VADCASSPNSTGPAGPLFEGQVGGYYLLSLLCGAEPRGLPGSRIMRVEMQRADQGRALDDIIIYAQQADGTSAVLEIQVKRDITFAPKDPIFEGVCRQIARTAARSDFLTTRYELAIATAKISRKIAGSYQDLLSWARSLNSAAIFFEQVQRAGSGNNDMRLFVDTFRTHLSAAGAPSDEDSVWQILRRLQILVFDFTATGSATETLVLERASHALQPEDNHRARDLWAILVERSLDLATKRGEANREQLIAILALFSFSLTGQRRFASARQKLAEASALTLADIGDRLGETSLNRINLLNQVHAACESSRYVELRGPGGVGKSALLKHFAQQIAVESQVIVSAAERVTKGGLNAWIAQLGVPTSGREFLSDLAVGGAAALFIDGLEGFTPAERTTIVDLVRVAAEIPGLAIVVTARNEFGTDEPSWLPQDALSRLGPPAVVSFEDLSEDEVQELRQATPQLAALLTDSHPARAVTRNLYRLSRLLRDAPSAATGPYTEAQMARRWWNTADGTRGPEHRGRARVLRALADHALGSSSVIDASTHDSAAINALIRSETLRDLGSDRVSFRHDVLREWGAANLIHEDSEVLGRFDLTRIASLFVARGLELAARLTLESDAEASRWSSMLNRLSSADTHDSWRRAVLLAIVRSERGEELLNQQEAALLADNGLLLRELVRAVYTVDVDDALTRLAHGGIDLRLIPEGLLFATRPELAASPPMASIIRQSVAHPGNPGGRLSLLRVVEGDDPGSRSVDSLSSAMALCLVGRDRSKQ
jgi:hypothetical protein